MELPHLVVGQKCDLLKKEEGIGLKVKLMEVKRGKRKKGKRGVVGGMKGVMNGEMMRDVVTCDVLTAQLFLAF